MCGRGDVGSWARKTFEFCAVSRRWIFTSLIWTNLRQILRSRCAVCTVCVFVCAGKFKFMSWFVRPYVKEEVNCHRKRHTYREMFGLLEHLNFCQKNEQNWCSVQWILFRVYVYCIRITLCLKWLPCNEISEIFQMNQSSAKFKEYTLHHGPFSLWHWSLDL